MSIDNGDRNLNLQDRVGSISLATAWVQMRDQYLTIAIQDGVPFDMLVTENKEQAISNHNKFVLTAELVQQTMERMEAEGKTIVAAPSRLLN